jgi:hypothetical protein
VVIMMKNSKEPMAEVRECVHTHIAHVIGMLELWQKFQGLQH